jgi:dihydroorotate dehydrogenase
VVGGTLTREPRPGNARPRIARTTSQRALVNAMGLPNPGAAAAARALARAPRTTSRWVSLADEPTEDAVAALRQVAPVADAIELNASSPNAGWAHRADHVREVVAAFGGETDLPVSVKVPPFREEEARAGVLAMATAAADAGAAALTCANTVPVADPRMSTGRGGLSGGPLTRATPGMVASLREATGLPVPRAAASSMPPTLAPAWTPAPPPSSSTRASSTGGRASRERSPGASEGPPPATRPNGLREPGCGAARRRSR